MTITQSVDHDAVGSWARLPASGTTTTGEHMSTTTTAQNIRATLDVFQALLQASQHPGLREVVPYGPGIGGIEGVKAKFGWGDINDYLWAYLLGNDIGVNGRPVDRKPTPKPFADGVPWADVPDAKMPDGTRRKWLPADYVLKFLHDLCEAAQPEPFARWIPVALENVGLGHGPNGLLVTGRSGSKLVLRVTIGSGPKRSPENDPWPDYRIPAEGMKVWEQQLQDIRKAPATPSSATSAGSVSVS